MVKVMMLLTLLTYISCAYFGFIVLSIILFTVYSVLCRLVGHKWYNWDYYYDNTIYELLCDALFGGFMGFIVSFGLPFVFIQIVVDIICFANKN
jgi:hypothetical protein